MHLILFIKVKAHIGIEGNEIVDKMAKEAANLPSTETVEDETDRSNFQKYI